METNVVEQPKSSDELLDAQLTASESTSPAPDGKAAVEVTEAPVDTPQPEKTAGGKTASPEPAETPALVDDEKGKWLSEKGTVTQERDTLRQEKSELAAQIDELTKQRDGLIGTKTRLRASRREKAEQLVRVEQELRDLRSQLAPAEDPLVAWKKSPENEGLVPPDEVVQRHDEYIVTQRQAQARPPGPAPPLAFAIQRANQLIEADRHLTMVLDAAIKEGWFGVKERDEVALAGDPVAKAREILLAGAEDNWSDRETALLHQLFPPPAPESSRPPAPPVTPSAPPAAAPPAPAPAPKATPKPKPKEQPDETDFPPEFGPRQKEIHAMFFPNSA